MSDCFSKVHWNSLRKVTKPFLLFYIQDFLTNIRDNSKASRRLSLQKPVAKSRQANIQRSTYPTYWYVFQYIEIYISINQILSSDGKKNSNNTKMLHIKSKDDALMFKTIKVNWKESAAIKSWITSWIMWNDVFCWDLDLIYISYLFLYFQANRILCFDIRVAMMKFYLVFPLT